MSFLMNLGKAGFNEVPVDAYFLFVMRCSNSASHCHQEKMAKGCVRSFWVIKKNSKKKKKPNPNFIQI